MHRLKGNGEKSEAGGEVKMETHSGLGASQWICERDGVGKNGQYCQAGYLRLYVGVGFGNREGIFS